MKISIIDLLKETKNRKKADEEPFIWLTTHQYPREQNKSGDKEPFIYLSSDKKEEEN